MSDEVQAYLSNLPKWSKFFEGFQLPPSVHERDAVTQLSQRLHNIRRRLRDGPDAPMRVAFFGPTGAGKSKLFSSLIRDDFSGSGFKRPFTRESFYFVHSHWRSLVAALEGEVSIHEHEAWRDTILIDTPDFDSVEQKNRAEAERVFLECDAFLFVTDALKYADASTWEYLKQIHDANKEFAIILNKVNSEAVVESFRERFERTLNQGQRAELLQVVVPEFRIDDATLIDEQHESMQLLRKTAQSLVTGDQPKQAASVDLLVKECEAFCSFSDDLRSRITSRRAQVDGALQALDDRAEAAKRRLNARLTAGLEANVREDVYQDVLRRLEKIDVLRYPRQLLAMPIQGIRSLVSQWWPNTKPVDDHSAAFADPASSETFHMLESELIAFADQSRNDIASRPALAQLVDRETFRALRLQHDELQALYGEHHQQFAKWVARNAEETAAEITTENKAKFVLSQVLFNTVLISSQVAMGPGFTMLDLGASGVISPMVAKGISMAIGSEKVKQFEDQARIEHQRSLTELVELAKARFAAHLEQSCEGLDALETQLNEISASRSQIDALVRHFQGSNRSQPSDASSSTGEAVE